MRGNMSYCDDCIDYDHKTKKCIPSGEDAGESVITCLSKRSYISNADRIREMNDEEMAKYLDWYSDTYTRDGKGWLEWLKQEAEE